jgi:pSer/pThr/pTyr-binding forkhead associated (FHA) protein
VLTGGQKGEDFRLREGTNSVGSAPENDVALGDAHVSGRHAHIKCILKDGEWRYVLVDLDSRNGTFLNEDAEPVFREDLVDNDRIVFGTTVCKFKCV